MKKDIEWLKEKVRDIARQVGDEYLYINIQTVLELIDQLDEPEVLSQEWIDEYAQGDYDEWVYTEDLQNLFVPKPEKVVVPKFVADWIEDLKSKKLNILESIYDFTHGEDIHDYMREKGNVLMRAWIDGYKIEEEQLFYALIKGHELSSNEFKYWNCKAYNTGHLLVGSKYPKASCINRMTKTNWNKIGINESNADFVKIEGVKE